jgi:hypothetical protein
MDAMDDGFRDAERQVSALRWHRRSGWGAESVHPAPHWSRGLDLSHLLAPQVIHTVGIMYPEGGSLEDHLVAALARALLVQQVRGAIRALLPSTISAAGLTG